MGHKVPITSLEAYKSQDQSHISKQYDKIILALKSLKAASAEQIANYLNMQHVQINRRMSEMERLQMVWKPGTKVPTNTGRSAFCWQLSSETTIHPAPIEKAMKGKTVAHFAKNIQQITQQSLF